jgi:hypothetical protein
MIDKHVCSVGGYLTKTKVQSKRKRKIPLYGGANVRAPWEWKEITLTTNIDAHRGGGGTSCTPSKDFEKLDHKNALKHENRGHPPKF